MGKNAGDAGFDLVLDQILLSLQINEIDHSPFSLLTTFPCNT